MRNVHYLYKVWFSQNTPVSPTVSVLQPHLVKHTTYLISMTFDKLHFIWCKTSHGNRFYPVRRIEPSSEMENIFYGECCFYLIHCKARQCQHNLPWNATDYCMLYLIHNRSGTDIAQCHLSSYSCNPWRTDLPYQFVSQILS